MIWLFLICATIGGTVLIGQFVLALVGFGHGDFLDDVPHDIPHDVHFDSGNDVHSPDPELGDHGVGHGNFSTWLFSLLSFKTITAASAFFGLAGCAANAAQMSPTAQIAIASIAGLAALYSVHWLMTSILRLGEDGTIRVKRSVGTEGVVYLAIPASRKGAGKVHFKFQNRLVAYPAITNHDEALASGAKVTIVGVEGDSTLEVMPWVEPKPAQLAAELQTR